MTTNTGKALVVTGRGIRSLKRQRSKQLGQIGRLQSRCTKHSRRWKKLQRAKNKVCRWAERRVRDLRHKATRHVIDFCVKQEVGTLFIGNPLGVRSRDSGRHHNGRMAVWEYGKDINYLTHTSKQARILSFTGCERGICIHLRSVRIRSFLVPSRISVLAQPVEGVVGQTRPTVV